MNPIWNSHQLSQTEESSLFSITGSVGIVYQNPQNSRELKDNLAMDLYSSQIQGEYATLSSTFSKEMPKQLNKLLKAYYFL
jgi:ClpP class serine protease